jgi:hypothetical protein
LSEDSSVQDTRTHIALVQEALAEVVGNLRYRAATHDHSKLVRPERTGYKDLLANLATIRYGSPEYAAALAEASETITHHYDHNSHHPQYHAAGILGMSLLDLIEMFCDWYAAGKRTSEGSLVQSLEVNRKRFASPETEALCRIFETTRIELGWE